MTAPDFTELSPASHLPTAEQTRPPRHLLTICWRQWRTERELKRRGLDFRTVDPRSAQQAYAAMSVEEFAAINGRQAWANARTISRSIAGLLPDRPVSAIDLGSGIGESTAVLASLLPAGSRVVGIEFAEPLVEVARSHATVSGGPARSVAFVVGSVTETFRDETGNPFRDASIDLVNASGIVGHHLDRADAERTASEIARVLASGGIAALDVGPRLSAESLADVMSRAGFVCLRRTRSNVFDRTGQVVFRHMS